MQKIERRQDRKDAKMNRKQDRRDTRLKLRKGDQNDSLGNWNTQPEDATPENPVLQREIATEETLRRGTGLTPVQRSKAQRYIDKVHNEQPEPEDEVLAAQAAMLRTRQIAETRRKLAQEMAQMHEGATPEDYPDPDEFPDYEDAEEVLAEAEAEEFGFDGSEIDYFDPATVGTLYAVGKSGTDKLRERQFAQGKKWFGKTQKQWEAEQKKKQEIAAGKLPDPSIINAMTREAERQAVEDYKETYDVAITIGIFALAALAFYAFRK